MTRTTWYAGDEVLADAYYIMVHYPTDYPLSYVAGISRLEGSGNDKENLEDRARYAYGGELGHLIKWEILPLNQVTDQQIRDLNRLQDKLENEFDA
jgi:hypothetical protein